MNDEWRTPKWLFDRLNQEFGPFDLDAAADAKNALCSRFWTKEDDALRQPWKGRVFCNPPYSKRGGPLAFWMDKAWDEVLIGRAQTIVMLVPLDATRWWAEAFARSHTVLLFDGRLSFLLPNGQPGHGNRAGSTVFVMKTPAVLDRAVVQLWHVP